MSVEFSGHSTRSGRGVSPARTRSASSRVSRTWLSSTARRSAKASIPSPGTSPWTAATWVVRAAPSSLQGAVRPTAPSAPETTTTASTRGQRRQRPGTHPQHGVGQRGAAQRDQGGGARRADQRDRGGQRGVDRRVGHRPPREAAPGHDAAQQLDPDPHQRGPHRPAGQRPHQGQADAEQQEEGGLQRHQPDGHVDPEHGDPADVQRHEGDAEGPADQRRAREPGVRCGDHERGEGCHGDREQPGDVVRLEGQGRQDAARGGGEAAQGGPAHRPNLSGRAAGGFPRDVGELPRPTPYVSREVAICLAGTVGPKSAREARALRTDGARAGCASRPSLSTGLRTSPVCQPRRRAGHGGRRILFGCGTHPRLSATSPCRARLRPARWTAGLSLGEPEASTTC